MSWRWIPPLLGDGRMQMAIDRWLLSQQEQSDAESVLRLYSWSRPTLSLGAHQSRLEPHWHELVATGQIELVRRPSGGRAVLHAGELTYALACRPASRHRLTAYMQACGWLQTAFAELGLPLRFGSTAARQARGRPSCFASGTAADLLHADGAKRIGSAQLWRGQALLQHGSILLTPDRDLWRQVFHEEPPTCRHCHAQRRSWCSGCVRRRNGACAEEDPYGINPLGRRSCRRPGPLRRLSRARNLGAPHPTPASNGPPAPGPSRAGRNPDGGQPPGSAAAASPQTGQQSLAELRPLKGAAGEPGWTENQEAPRVRLVELENGLPERSRFGDAGQEAEGLQMIAHQLAVPALHRQTLQRFVVDEALPATAVAHQQPIGWALPIAETGAAELTQTVAGLEHAETALGRILDLQLAQGRLQGQQLTLVAV